MNPKTLRMQLFAASILLLAFAPCSFEAAGLGLGGAVASPEPETSESADDSTNEPQGEAGGQSDGNDGTVTEDSGGGIDDEAGHGQTGVSSAV